MTCPMIFGPFSGSLYDYFVVLLRAVVVTGLSLRRDMIGSSRFGTRRTHPQKSGKELSDLVKWWLV